VREVKGPYLAGDPGVALELEVGLLLSDTRGQRGGGEKVEIDKGHRVGEGVEIEA
jgi:hypothetical protein